MCVVASVLLFGVKSNQFIISFAVCGAYNELVSFPLWQSSIIVFVLAWIGQFYGHKIEGIKPSFFEDLQFLMIGPAWLMSFIYNKFGIRY